MANRVDHLSILTREHDRVVAFMQDVLGLGVYRMRRNEVDRDLVNKLFGWTSGADEIKVPSNTYLSNSAEDILLEVVQVSDAADPEYVPGHPPVGIWQVSLVCDDIAAVAQAAKEFGVDFMNEPITILTNTFIRVHVGGVRFELKQLGAGKKY